VRAISYPNFARDVGGIVSFGATEWPQAIPPSIPPKWRNSGYSVILAEYRLNMALECESQFRHPFRQNGGIAERAPNMLMQPTAFGARDRCD
jgi:hypothetical protein